LTKIHGLPSQAGSRSRGLVSDAGAFLFFVALALFATRPLASQLRDQTLAGPDPLIDLWTVHWLSSHLLHQPAQLFGGNIFHPAAHAVVYSDLSLGTAVLLAPLRLFVSDPVPLYNLAVLLALAFGGWAWYRLTCSLTGSASSGLLAGVLAAFGSHQLYHSYHLNLLTTAWLPLLLVGLHRGLTHGGARFAILSGVSFALAAQSSGYYAVAALLLALGFAVGHWRGLRQPRGLLTLGAGAVLAFVLLIPYARAFLEVRAQQGLRRPEGMSERMAFRPGVDLSSHGYLYRGVLGSEGERLFPGLLAPILACLALRRRAPHAVFYAGVVVLLGVVSLGPRLSVLGVSLPLPYRALYALPPLDAMRHPYTFAALATCLLAVLAGIGWAALGAPRWAGALIVIGALLETLAPPLAVRSVPRGVPPAYRKLESLPPGPILELPVFAEETLVWAARHGQPVLNGVGAFVPRETQALETAVRNQWLHGPPEDIDDSRPIDLLHDLDVRYLIVPSGRVPRMRHLADALEHSTSFHLVAEADDGDRIFEVTLSHAGETREHP
jgi:hypothetical protein